MSLLAVRLRAFSGVIGLVGFVLLWGTTWVARAESKGKGPDAPGYRDAISAALSEYQEGGYLEAKTLFTRAHELYPNARTLRGLGLVSFELRDYAGSVDYLEQALASRERPLEGSMRVELESLLKRARGFVAEIQLSLEPSSAEVRVDGIAAKPREGGTLLLAVGEHVLTFVAEGYGEEQRAYRVLGGERERLNVSLHRIDTPTPVPAQAEARGDAHPLRLRRWKWTMLTLASASAATSVVGVALRQHDAQRIQDSCTSHTSRCNDLHADGVAWRGVAIGAGTLSAALIATTVGLFYADASRERPTLTSRVLRTCAPGATGLSLFCQGTF